jgi:glycosyltransferase involved in cell wall biosynthesis
MGNLVLASNHGGAVESIIEGTTGWLFEPRNPAALSDSLKNALTLTEKKRLIISNNAQKHIKEKFSTQLMCMRTLSVYSEILNFKQARKNH